MTLTIIRDGVEVPVHLSTVRGGGELGIWSAGSLSVVRDGLERPLGHDAPTVLDPTGVGSWWQLPRAVELHGQLYSGGVDNHGNGSGTVFVLQTDLRTRRTLRRDLGTLSPADDHNNPALLISIDSPPLVALTEHNGGTYVWRGTTPGDLSTLAATPTMLQWPNVASYLQLWREAGTSRVHMLSRSGLANHQWWRKLSTDDGATWGPSQLVIDAATNQQHYLASVLVGDRLRCAAVGHPNLSSDHDIRVFSVHLPTGSIDTLDGATTIGQVGPGVETHLLPLAYAPPPGTNTRLYDIGAGPEPEIVFATWSSGHATYRYARAGDGWLPRDLAIAGLIIGDAPTRRYHAGVSIPNPSPGGIVYLCREAAGTWYLERHRSRDGGATWQVTTLHTSTTEVLARPYCPVGRTVSGPEVTLYGLSDYTDFTRFAGRALAV